MGGPGFTAGTTLHAQYLYPDLGFQAGYQYNSTDALKFTIGL
jgi:hypothetical protein